MQTTMEYKKHKNKNIKQLSLFPDMDKKHKLNTTKENLKINIKESFIKSLKLWIKVILKFPGIIAWVFILISQFSITNLTETISIIGVAYNKAEITQRIAFTEGLEVISFYTMFFTFVIIYTSILIPSLFVSSTNSTSPVEEILTDFENNENR